MEDPFEEPVAIACQNNAVPDASQRQYIARGTWVVDFNTGYSFESSDAPSSSRTEAGEVFNRIEEASQAGGIGTLRSDESQLIAIGRFGTDGISLLNQLGDDNKRKKGLQFSEYTVLGTGDPEYEEAREIGDTLGGTVVSLKSRDGKKESLETLLQRLEEAGYLRKPVR
jgi:hypothetical protein